jgi:hypothetical protein
VDEQLGIRDRAKTDWALLQIQSRQNTYIGQLSKLFLGLFSTSCVGPGKTTPPYFENYSQTSPGRLRRYLICAVCEATASHLPFRFTKTSVHT